MEGARTGEVCPEEGHLIGKNAPPLQIDVFGMIGCEGNGQQLHAGFFGQVTRGDVKN